MSSSTTGTPGRGSSGSDPRLFVLLPVGNDREVLEPFIERLREFMSQRGWTYQVLAVDDGSDDGSAGVLDRAKADAPVEVITHRFPRGLRETLRDGLEWIADRCSADDVAVIVRPDQGDQLGTLPVMIAAIEAGADVVVAAVGERRSGSSAQRAREAFSTAVLRAMFRVPGVRDYASSFIALRGRTLQLALQRYRGKLFEHSTADFVCPLELLAKLARCGAACTEVSLPIRGAKERRATQPLIDGFRAYAALFRGLRRRERPPPVPEMPAPLPRWEWAALAAIMAAGLAVRLYAIERIPEVVFHDECDNLVNVYQILNGKGPGLFGFDWKPQPAASVYVLSLFMRMGNSILTLRLPAALYSLAALIPFYLLLRRVVSAPAALLAATLLAADIWYLHFSRAGWENVSACLFLAGAALCTRDGIRSGRMRSFAYAGVWAALGAYGYFSGRAVLLAVVATVLLAVLRPRLPRVRLVAGLVVAVAVTFALYAPQLPHILRHWDLFQKRTRAVSILAERPQQSFAGSVGLLARNFGRKARQVFVGHPSIDRYLRLDQGPLPLGSTLLLGLGLMLSFFRWRDTWIWWVFLLVPFALTQVLTTGELNGARGVIFVPMLYLFVGLTLQAFWRACTSAARPLAAVVVAGGLALAVSSTRQYFEWIQTPRVVEDLQPAIPVAEFADWQKHVLDWTGRTNDFFNVYMWKDLQARRQAQPGVAPQQAP
jgi:hypothetical protein